MALTQFSKNHLVKPTEVPSRNIIDISVDHQLTDRRIYAYLETKGPNGTTDQWILTAIVKLYRNGLTVGDFPIAIGKIDTSTINEELTSLINSGGSVVGDSLVLRLNNPFDTTNGPFSVVLQPLRVSGDIDRISLEIVSFSGASVTGWRGFLGCLSMQA